MPNIKGLNTTLEQFVRFAKNSPELSLVVVDSKKELSDVQKQLAQLEYVNSKDHVEIFHTLENAKKTFAVIESVIPPDLYDVIEQYRSGHIMLMLEGKGKVIYPDYTNCSLLLIVRDKDLVMIEKTKNGLLRLVGPTMRYGKAGAWDMPDAGDHEAEEIPESISEEDPPVMNDTQFAQFSNNVNKLFGFSVQFLQQEERSYVPTQESSAPMGRLAKIPHMKELVEHYKQFHLAVRKKAVSLQATPEDTIGRMIDDNRDPQRLVSFMKNNYRNDAYITWRQALKHLYIDKFQDQEVRGQLYHTMQVLGFLPSSLSQGDAQVGLEEEQKKDLIGAINSLLGKLEESGKVPSDILSLEVSLADLPVDKQIATAIQLLGRENVIGPEQVGEIYGVEIVLEGVPDMPFSQSDLQRAKDLNAVLVYRLNSMSGDRALTMQALNTYFQDSEDESRTELLSDTGWYRDDPFYKDETPALGWALVSRDVLKHSNKKFYMQQIQEIIQYLRGEVFAERRLPSQYEEAMTQFDTLFQTMKHSKKNMKPEYMTEMQVTQYTRPSAVEMLYDMMTLLKTGGEEAVIRDDRTFWTRTLDKNGSIVELSSYHSTGIDVSSWKCDHKSKDLYATVARTV